MWMRVSNTLDEWIAAVDVVVVSCVVVVRMTVMT
jgi:hypothetical protein